MSLSIYTYPTFMGRVLAVEHLLRAVWIAADRGVLSCHSGFIPSDDLINVLSGTIHL